MIARRKYPIQAYPFRGGAFYNGDIENIIYALNDSNSLYSVKKNIFTKTRVIIENVLCKTVELKIGDVLVREFGLWKVYSSEDFEEQFQYL